MPTFSTSPAAFRPLVFAVLMAFVAHAGGQNPARAQDDRPDRSIEKEIAALIRDQADAWNRGSIDEFMVPYWNSERLTFSSGGQTTRGWQATLESYRRRYATREQMGKLTFDQLEITPLGETAALVLGLWRLERAEEPVAGNFSLVFRRLDGNWRIIHDHTSRDATVPKKPSAAGG